MSDAPVLQNPGTDRTALAPTNGNGSNGSDSEHSSQRATAQLMSQLLLDRSEVAVLLRVPENAVNHLHRCRQLRGVFVGRNLRWKPETVRQFVDELNPDD